MRRFILVTFGIMLAVWAISRGSSLGQSRQTNRTPRPVSLTAALGGRLAVLRSADGRASYIPGRFEGASSIAVTPDGNSIMVGPAVLRKSNLDRGVVSDAFCSIAICVCIT